MFYRPFICLTVSIFLAVPSINCCSVYQQRFCARSFQFNFMEKRAYKHMIFFLDHLIDINLWIKERYYCNWLKFSFRPNFGDFCDMFTPLFCYILYLRNADCCHGYTQKGLYFTLMTIRNQIYGRFSFYKYIHA